MALTKTVNYTQTLPQSLGFSNEISGTAGTVGVEIQYLPGMGRLNTGSYGASTSTMSEIGDVGIWSISGTEANVNQALNDLTWKPRAYEWGNEAFKDAVPNAPEVDTPPPTVADLLDLLQNGPPEEEEEETPPPPVKNGEFVLEFYDPNNYIGTLDLTSSKLSFGQIGVELDGTTPIYSIATPFITRTEQVPGSNFWKVYCIIGGTGSLGGDQFTSIDKGLKLLINGLSESQWPTITNFEVDNPVGDTNLSISVVDNGSVFTSGTVTLVGDYLFPLPAFTQDPPLVIPSDSAIINDLGMGIVDTNINGLIGVQLLVKRYPSDPAFDGDLTTNEASYLTDESYCKFSTVKVNNRQSSTKLEDPKIRWEFYGTPAECNQALREVSVMTEGISVNTTGTASTPRQDCFIETRIVTPRKTNIFNKGVL